MMRSTGILSVGLSVCVRMFTFRIYSCSNSTITHAKNLCANFFSHVVCACSTSRSALFSVENKNKPVSLPIVVIMCTVGGRLPTIFLFGKVPSKLQLEYIFQLTIAARIHIIYFLVQARPMMHMHLLGILGALFSYEIADPLMKMGALMESPVTVISDVIGASRSEPHTSVFN